MDGAGEYVPRMTLRIVSCAGMLEAERQFRRIIGYRDLARLAVAIERDLTPTIRTLTNEAVTLNRD